MVFKDNSYGRHECLDRTHILREMVEDFLTDHPSLQDDERKLAEQANDALYDLYQLIGKREL